jgi:hypothetical protein
MMLLISGCGVHSLTSGVDGTRDVADLLLLATRWSRLDNQLMRIDIDKVSVTQ